MRRVMSALAAAVIAAVPASAQTAQPAPAAAPAITEDFKPSSLNQPGQQYPQVNSQGYVRFRIVAPSIGDA